MTVEAASFGDPIRPVELRESMANTLIAHVIAAPVLEWVRVLPSEGRRGLVLGAGDSAAHLEVEGFVVTVTTSEVPLMPNAISLTAPSGATRGFQAGGHVRFQRGHLQAGEAQVRWDALHPPAWDPAIAARATRPSRGVALVRRVEAVAARGRALLKAACGVDPSGWTDSARALADWMPATMSLPNSPGGSAAVRTLLKAVFERDPRLAREAALVLLGRGEGLTPEGDDLIAAVAVAVAVLGPMVGLDQDLTRALLISLVPDDLCRRTNALSATLLTLASRGCVAEPLGSLLDPGNPAWPGALSRLRRLGHSTGLTYAYGVGAAGLVLALGCRFEPHSDHSHRARRQVRDRCTSTVGRSDRSGVTQVPHPRAKVEQGRSFCRRVFSPTDHGQP